MKSVKCPNCGRVLGKADDDGTFHIRVGKDGPQIFVGIKDLRGSSVMVVCPSVVYTPGGKIKCGTRHVLNEEILSELSALSAGVDMASTCLTA